MKNLDYVDILFLVRFFDEYSRLSSRRQQVRRVLPDVAHHRFKYQPVPFAVGVDAVGADVLDKIAAFQKGAADIDAGGVFHSGNVFDAVGIALLPPVNPPHAFKPF